LYNPGRLHNLKRDLQDEIMPLVAKGILGISPFFVCPGESISILTTRSCVFMRIKWHRLPSSNDYLKMPCFEHNLDKAGTKMK
jgi:hypothetical protein